MSYQKVNPNKTTAVQRLQYKRAKLITPSVSYYMYRWLINHVNGIRLDHKIRNTIETSLVVVLTVLTNM